MSNSAGWAHAVGWYNTMMNAMSDAAAAKMPAVGAYAMGATSVYYRPEGA